MAITIDIIEKAAKSTRERLGISSGMIETKESDFGFPLALVCATIPYAHRDHI
jgi:hypothetical protein